MNLLEFPDEVLLSVCTFMDPLTRSRLRRTCRFMNSFLPNSKLRVSKETIQAWNDKAKMLLGLAMLENLVIYQHLDIGNFLNQKVILHYDPQMLPQVGISYSWILTPMLTKLMKDFPEYELQASGKTVQRGSNLFNVLILKNVNTSLQDCSFDQLQLSCFFLYDLYIRLATTWQKKYESRVKTNSYAEILETCWQKDFYKKLLARFMNREYLTIPYNVSEMETRYRGLCEKIANDLQQEMKEYFLDGNEVYQFVKTLK